jgi:hypothetical protein
MDPRHDIIARLERTTVPYYVTGSEAMAAHGLGYRLTNDIDVILDVDIAAYDRRIRREFEPDYVVNALLAVDRWWLGSAIGVATVAKVDFIVRRPDAWGREVFGRRVRIDDPGLGTTWVATIEDILLAKLEWAQGDLAGLQGKDIERIIEAVPDLDRTYLERQAAVLGLRDSIDRAFDR